MKKTALLILAVITAASCMDGGMSKKISVEFVLNPEISFQTMMLVPDVSLDVATFEITGSGPAGTTFVISTDGNSCLAEDILPGDWVIHAEGTNSDDVVLLTGDSSVLLTAETEEVVLTLSAIDGTGSIDTEVGWDDTLIQDPVFSLVLAGADGTVIDIDAIVTPGAASFQTDVPAGLYKLIVQLSDGSELAAGAADLVRVIAGSTTSGEIYLDINLQPITSPLVLAAPELAPVGIGIDGYDPPLFVGETVLLSTSTTGDTLPGFVFDWYINGALSSTSSELSFASEMAGRWRIDLLGTDGAISGGTGTLTLAVYEPVFYGSLLFVESIQDNADGNDGLAEVRSVAVVGDFLYTAGYGEDKIGIYSIDSGSGKLAFLDDVVSADLGDPALLDGVSDLSYHPGTNRLAAVSSRSGALLLLDPDASTGALSLVDSAQPVAADFPSQPAGIDPAVNALNGATALSFGSAGTVLYAVSSSSSLISSFSISSGSLVPSDLLGPPSLIGTAAEGLLDGPEDIAVSPDSTWLAAASKGSDSLILFGVEPVGGALTLARIFADGQDGVDGLNGANGLSFSPDGRDLYVTGYYDDMVGLFSLEPATGLWSYEGCFDDEGEPDVKMHYPRGVAVSNDGTEVYVCAGGSDALTVFERAAASGALGTATSAVDGDDRNVGFDLIRGVEATEGGEFVFTVASGDNAVGVFRRE
jgi:6-phosphogluconolactonase (cycloisomerase 2 family)